MDIDGKRVKLQEVSTKGYHLYRANASIGETTLNRFNANCNNRYRGQYDFIEVEPGEHTVTVYISAQQSDKVKILGAKQQEDIAQHPDRYARTALYLGKILMRGQPIK
jgi:hypothetical protein